MKRREFILVLGGAAAWPLAARAQQPERVRRIGLLIASAEKDWEGQQRIAAFRQGFQELGWAEGRNFVIEIRWGAGDAKLVKTYVAELIAWSPDIILCGTTIGALELRRVTHAIPMVFANVADPIGIGLIQSLSNPGENITGFAAFEYAIIGKWLEILKEIAPRVTRVALIFNRETGPQGFGFLRSLEQVAPSFGVTPTSIAYRDPAEVAPAIDAFARDPGGGLLVVPEAGAIAQRLLILEGAARNRLPAVYPLRYFTIDGGLAAYGVDNNDQWRRAASYVDRILKGTKASDLPVQAPVKFELAFNLKTAKAIGIEIPPGLLARADEVIE